MFYSFETMWIETGLLVATLLLLYVVRDSELLRLGIGRGGLQPRALIYAGSLTSAVTLGAILVRSLDVHSYLLHIRQVTVVLPMIAIQVGIWVYYARVRRTGDLSRLWLVAVIPSPVLVLTLTGLAVVLDPTPSGWPALLLGILISCLWLMCVLWWAKWSMNAEGTDDPRWGLSFVSISNLWVLLLIPMENLTQALSSLENAIKVILAYD